jgi:hypothetical protein
MSFINVKYGEISTRIKVKDLEDISELRRSIKEEYGAHITAPPVDIQLYKSYHDEGQKAEALITDLDDIPEEYYKKLEDGGSVLEIRTSSEHSLSSSSAIRKLSYSCFYFIVD